MSEIDLDKVFYYGCWGEVGHYLFSINGKWPKEYPSKWPWGGLWETARALDGGFCPEIKGQPEGKAKLTFIEPDWTVMSFWDRSVDTRGGSHSTFVAPGNLTFDQMIDACKRAFPNIWKRYQFKVEELK